MTAGRPEFSDEATAVFVATLEPLADRVRVRVIEAQCQGCGEAVWPLGEGVAWTVAAAVLRGLATQWHHDDCPGPVQFTTEPEPSSTPTARDD